MQTSLQTCKNYLQDSLHFFATLPRAPNRWAQKNRLGGRLVGVVGLGLKSPPLVGVGRKISPRPQPCSQGSTGQRGAVVDLACAVQPVRHGRGCDAQLFGCTIVCVRHGGKPGAEVGGGHGLRWR